MIYQTKSEAYCPECGSPEALRVEVRLEGESRVDIDCPACGSSQPEA